MQHFFCEIICFFYFVLFWLCFKHGYDIIGFASNTKTFTQESVTLNITYGLPRLLLTTLTTLGLYGGSIFLSYKSCQSIVLKNGWHLISSCWEADHVKVIFYLATYVPITAPVMNMCTLHKKAKNMAADSF